MPDQLLDTTGTGTDIAGQDHSHTLADTKVTVRITHTEFAPDHITDAIQDIVTPALIAITVTHHTGDHPHAEVYQPIPENVAGPGHAHHTNPVRTPHLNPHPAPAGQQQNPRIRIKRKS